MNQTLDYILIFGGIQGFLLSLVILTKNRFIANRFLAAFIALLGLGCMLDNRLDLVDYFYYLLFWAGNSFLFAPLLFLYIKTSVEINKRIGKYYIHFIPFISIKILVLSSFLTDPVGKEFWLGIGVFLNYFLIGYNFIYLYNSFKLVSDENRRGLKPKRLIHILLGVYIAYNVIFLFRRLIEQFSAIDISLFENYLYLGVALINYLISGLIIYQPTILQPRGKYKKSAISMGETNKYGITIERFFTSSQSFLDSDFSFSILCEHIGINKHQGSQVLGQYFSMSFYELLNQYRIAEFCKRIDRKEHERKSILGIAMECGYRSKSTFNTAFKKVKNMSPSDYVKQSRRDK